MKKNASGKTGGKKKASKCRKAVKQIAALMLILVVLIVKPPAALGWVPPPSMCPPEWWCCPWEPGACAYLPLQASSLVQQLKDSVQKIAEFTNWVLSAVSLNDELGLTKQKMDDDISKKTATQNVASYLDSLTSSKLHEDQQAQKAALANTKSVAAREAKEDDPNVMAIASNLVMARQAQAELFLYAQAVENVITESSMSWNRGSYNTDTTMGGPYQAFLTHNMDCPAKGSPYEDNLKSGNAELDLAPDTCVQKFSDGTVDTEAADINITASMLVSPGQPGPLFVFPALKTIEESGAGGTVIRTKLPVPDTDLLKVADTDGKAAETFVAQQLFMAAVKFCFHAMGARPARPSEEMMFTPAGLSIGAQWDHCAAIQSAMARQCAALIAYHTIPYCADNLRGGTYDKLCADSLIACQAAAALGTQLPFDCKHPMSMYRAELASQLVCFATERYMVDKTGDSKDETAAMAQGVFESDNCQANYARWKSRVQMLNANFQLALKALLKMKKCWPEWSPQPSIGTPEQIAAAKARRDAAAAKRAAAAAEAEAAEAAASGDTSAQTVNEMIADYWEKLEKLYAEKSKATGAEAERIQGEIDKLTSETRTNIANVIEKLYGAPAATADPKSGNFAMSFATGFDCSGLTWYASQLAGNNFERGSADSYYQQALNNENGWTLVPISQMQPGDTLVVDKDGNGAMDHASFVIGTNTKLGPSRDLLNSPGMPGYSVNGGSSQYYINKYGSSNVYVLRHTP